MGRKNKKPRLKRHGIMKRWSGKSTIDKSFAREQSDRARSIGSPEPPDRSTEAKDTHATRVWKSIRRTGITTFHPQLMRDNRFERIVMFFSGNDYFFTRWDKKTDITHQSMDYYGKTIALSVFNREHIAYTKIISRERPEQGIPRYQQAPAD